MINIRKICVVFTFLCTTSVYSVELREFDYTQIFKQLNPVTDSDVSSINGFAETLGRDQEVSRTIRTHQALTILSISQAVSDEQKKWVNGLVSSKDSLSIISADHPRKRMKIIDISRQASATLQLWQVNMQATELEQKWLSSDWQWSDVFNPASALEKQGLLLWLERSSSQKAKELASYLEQQPIELSVLPNDLLAVIAQRASSNMLFAELWSRDTDHIVYRALNKLPTSLSDSDAITQLKLATHNPQLVSQALFRLSKDYGQQIEAQNFIEQALFDPRIQLHMAATVSVIDDVKFKDRLKRLLADSNSKVAKMAMKQLNKEPLL